MARNPLVSSRCIFCGNPVWYNETRNRWQKVHTECALQNPPDFHYRRGEFTLDLRSTIIEPKKLRKIFKNL